MKEIFWQTVWISFWISFCSKHPHKLLPKVNFWWNKVKNQKLLTLFYEMRYYTWGAFIVLLVFVWIHKTFFFFVEMAKMFVEFFLFPLFWLAFFNKTHTNPGKKCLFKFLFSISSRIRTARSQNYPLILFKLKHSTLEKKYKEPDFLAD